MEQPRGGKAAERAGGIESHQPLPLPAMNRPPSTFLEREKRRGRMMQIEPIGRYGRGVSEAKLIERVLAHGCREDALQVSSTHRERDTSAIRQHRGSHCKAQSAMQGPQRAPQTRSTATALVVALRGKHNLRYAEFTIR